MQVLRSPRKIFISRLTIKARLLLIRRSPVGRNPSDSPGRETANGRLTITRAILLFLQLFQAPIDLSALILTIQGMPISPLLLILRLEHRASILNLILFPPWVTTASVMKSGLTRAIPYTHLPPLIQLLYL